MFVSGDRFYTIIERGGGKSSMIYTDCINRVRAHPQDYARRNLLCSAHGYRSSLC